jgi:hypothetical protein
MSTQQTVSIHPPNTGVPALCQGVCDNVDNKVHAIVDKDLLQFMADFFGTNRSSSGLLDKFSAEFHSKFNGKPASYMAAIFQCLFIAKSSTSDGGNACFTQEQINRVVRALNGKLDGTTTKYANKSENYSTDQLIDIIRTLITEKPQSTPFCTQKDLVEVCEYLAGRVVPGTTTKEMEKWKTGDEYVDFFKETLEKQSNPPKQDPLSNDTLSKQSVEKLLAILRNDQDPDQSTNPTGHTLNDWKTQLEAAIGSIDDHYNKKIGQLCSCVDAYINQYNTMSIPDTINAKNFGQSKHSLVEGLESFVNKRLPLPPSVNVELNEYSSTNPIKYDKENNRYLLKNALRHTPY